MSMLLRLVPPVVLPRRLLLSDGRDLPRPRPPRLVDLRGAERLHARLDARGVTTALGRDALAEEVAHLAGALPRVAVLFCVALLFRVVALAKGTDLRRPDALADEATRLPGALSGVALMF